MISTDKIVSIITPSFNRADIVHETAESIFGQSYPHWEWVIVDDGSTDNSWEVLQSFAARDQRVKIFKRDREPKGACTCRNMAVEKCSGEYLLFLDTDDLLAPYCLEQRVQAFEEAPENDFIIFPMLIFKKEPYDLGLLWNIENNVDDLLRLLYGDPVCQGTGTLWKKKSFVDIGMWKEELLLWQDIELHIRSLQSGLKYQKRLDLRPDVFLRESEVSLSRTGFHSLQKLNSRIQVLQEALKRSAEKDDLPEYQQGFRVMFFSIFNNAVRARHAAAVKALLAIATQYGLFDRKSYHSLKRFAFFYLSRMYKIPGLGLLFGHATLPAHPYRPLLGKVQYKDVVHA